MVMIKRQAVPLNKKKEFQKKKKNCISQVIRPAYMSLPSPNMPCPAEVLDPSSMVLVLVLDPLPLYWYWILFQIDKKKSL